MTELGVELQLFSAPIRKLEQLIRGGHGESSYRAPRDSRSRMNSNDRVWESWTSDVFVGRQPRRLE